jgi:pimeloyl-ACP methyl ester carboxylesterase
MSPSGSSPPELTGVRHAYVEADGLRTHVALAGTDDQPPILLVHGWPQNWWTWRHVIPRLAERFRVIVPDLRGHGWTEAPAAGYDKQQLATDLLSLLDVLGVERVTWVGHDWGGFAGLLAALRAPDRIERMLIACIPHLWAERDPRQLALMLSYQGPLSLPILGPRIADPLARRILQAGRGADRLAPADVALFADQLLPRVTVAMYRTFLTQEVTPIARGRYADQTLQVPTTLLIGDRDLVTRAIAAGPVDGQPQLRVESVPDAAHWVPEQRPQAIIDWAVSRSG